MSSKTSKPMDELLYNVIVNQSELVGKKYVNYNGQNVTDFYEIYRLTKLNCLRTYRYLGFVLGTVIILSNLPVVVSSGLILRKGQKPRSTYMLLGNVSLADTIVGISLICGIFLSENGNSPSTPCIIQIGMMVCPAMVSIFSIGLIAVDRYIYILHGLYYKRWFSTTRVRIAIFLIWIIGIVLGFFPATGYVNEELLMTRCFYVSLFPEKIILLNSVISIIPISVVAILYAIILVKALQTVKTINGTIKVKHLTPVSKTSELRLNRGTMVERKTTDVVKAGASLKRSASFTLGSTYILSKLKCKSKSIDDLSGIERFNSKVNRYNNRKFDSEFSIYTLESGASLSLSTVDKENNKQTCAFSRCSKGRKTKEPNKWRAITVVLVTTGTIVLTWLPFFVTVIFFVFCEDKLTNLECVRLRFWLGVPLPFLAFTNSIVNPIVYAWWHKGFKKSVKTYYKRYCKKYFCRVVL